MITRRTGLKMMGAASLVLAAPPVLGQSGTVHEVEMLNKHPDLGNMVFSPSLIVAEPGDTIRWIPTDRGHNSESTKGMLPEGAETWKSKINDEFEITLEVEGAYGYNCTPHFTTGMVGLILVGNVTNLDALKEVRTRGKAKQRYEDLFAQAEELLAS